MSRVKTSDVRILALSLSGELRQPPPNQKDSKTKKNKNHVPAKNPPSPSKDSPKPINCSPV